MRKKKVAIVGATGVAGQQFVTALTNHPWFEIACLASSERSAGKTYREALTTASGQVQWFQEEELDPRLGRMTLARSTEINLDAVDIVFTAIDSTSAMELEPLYAKRKPTISTASAFRMAPDVPLLIPGINTDHRNLLQKQRQSRGWDGFIVPIPNCTTYGLACTLAPIHKDFGVELVVMTSLQATSGAGRNGGTLALDVIDNLIPYIPGEEEKVEMETQKILGSLVGQTVTAAPFAVSATCTRVPVTDGHTETVFVKTKQPCTADGVRQSLLSWDHGLGALPTAPRQFFKVYEDPYHPQPRLDRNVEGGMTTHVGRLRQDTALPGVKYVLLSHNTKAGAAKGALLVAELLCETGDIKS